jgi:hypothetical protein
MNDWRAPLKQNPIAWLLQSEDASIRYYTLTDLLDIPRDDPQVIAARQAIGQSTVVAHILSRQKPGGWWGKPEDFYERSKYKGTVWNLILLAELGMDGQDPRMQQAGEFILTHAQDPESGGFAYLGQAEVKGDPSLKPGGSREGVIPCLTGNMVFSLIRLGWLDDPRVQAGLGWITTYQRFDDRDTRAPHTWPYTVHGPCWGRHACTMGVVKALKALAEVPVARRTPAVLQTIEAGVDFLLRHHLYRRSHDLTRVAKPAWLLFSFPWMYHTDALEMALILVRLGCRDPRMQDAVDLILSKQDDQGRWILEQSCNKRMLAPIEQEGQPSRWVTLNALRVLKGWVSPDPAV